MICVNFNILNEHYCYDYFIGSVINCFITWVQHESSQLVRFLSRSLQYQHYQEGSTWWRVREDPIIFFIVLEHLDLEDIELLEDFSVSSSFPQSEDDILQRQLYKSTDCAPIDLNDESISSHKYEDENIGGFLEIKEKKRDSAKRNAKERFYL